MKTCYRCKVEQPKENFTASSKSKDGLHSWCKGCKRSKYLEDAERVKARTKARNQRQSEIISEIVREAKSAPCSDCGKSYPPYVMDFDHRRDKSFNISEARRRGYSIESIRAEIEKCEVVCSNCHRERTFGTK